MGKTNVATGNWSTAATWGQWTNTPTIHASTNITLSASNTFTATFTAPNTTNACKGVHLYLPVLGTATVNVTLQESTVDTAATRSVTFSSGSATTNATWVYFEFATPYTFTTTGAGAYRFRINATSITTASQVAADSGGTLAAYIAVDDRTGAPGAEPVLITGANYATARTVTMDGTQSCGAGTDTAQQGAGSQRSIGFGVQCAAYGKLSFDTAASATLTCLGHFQISGQDGELEIGTSSSRYPAAYTATLRLNQNGTGGNHAIYKANNGKLTLYGQQKSSTTLWKTSYVSGLGTAASPAVMADAVDWAVGDEVIIVADAYNQSETRFIISKISATTFVWASTAGGSEAALVNTHDSDHKVYNIGRNIVIDTTNTSHGLYLANTNSTGSVNVDWVRFNNVGSSTVSKQGIYPSINGGGGLTATTGNFNYCVIGNAIGSGWAWTNSQATETFTGLGVVNSSSAIAGTTNGAINFLTTADNKTLVDPFVINVNGSALSLGNSKGCTLTRPELWCWNASNTATIGGIYLGGPVNYTINDLNLQSGRQQGMMFAGATKVTFNDAISGTIGTNTIDINFTSSSLNLDVHFEAPNFGSGTLISNYTTQAVASKITMQGVNANVNDHRTYETTGTTRSTGTGLSDTNVRTASSLAWRLAPENNTTGIVKEFKILARANSAVQILGFLQKNSTFGSSTLTVELILPGETTAAASQTMANDTSWNPFSLAANYTGTTDRLATVRITAISATAGAYIYMDDIYNGSTTNKFISVDMFDRGEPAAIMFEQLGDAATVWAVQTSTMTASGTIGYLVKQIMTFLRFFGSKLNK